MPYVEVWFRRRGRNLQRRIGGHRMRATSGHRRSTRGVSAPVPNSCDGHPVCEAFGFMAHGESRDSVPWHAGCGANGSVAGGHAAPVESQLSGLELGHGLSRYSAEGRERQSAGVA